MDNKFYIDDFERYLKEKADEFKMYPSKRVWNSIYNDMHPGSRWPSISMCIVLIGTLFLVGFLNTNTTISKSATVSLANQTNIPSIPASYNAAADLGNTVVIDISSKQDAINTTAAKNILPAVNAQHRQYNKNATPLAIASSINKNTADQKLLADIKKINTVDAEFTVSTDHNNKIIAGETESRLSGDDANSLAISNNSTMSNYQNSIIEKNNHYEDITKNADADLQITIVAPENVIPAVNESAKPAFVKTTQLSEADKFWIENYVMYNRPEPKKWKGKLSWQTYITPSVVYRSLENTAVNKNVGLAGLTNNSDINNSITQTPSFGLEFGTGLQYGLSKRIKIKGGFQLNFARYNAHAFDNGHPIATSITMLNNNADAAYQEYRISPYNSNYGITPVKLHNQTYQISLPIGADYKIAAIDNLEWYAGASIQPTFVLGGSSYLISTDRRNYVKESAMMNRFNLNAGFETYIAIKTKGLTWQIGPQFRKQIFSTNSKTYSIEERFMNYGLKIGVAKKL
jgi:hypothetical protein